MKFVEQRRKGPLIDVLADRVYPCVSIRSMVVGPENQLSTELPS